MERVRRLVAIVDDEAGVSRALARLVRSLGFDVATYLSGEALLAGIEAAPPDDVLLDLHLPGVRGTDLLTALRVRQVTARVIVMTGLDQPGSRQACLDAGAFAYITKPIRRDVLALLLVGRVAEDGE